MNPAAPLGSDGAGDPPSAGTGAPGGGRRLPGRSAPVLVGLAVVVALAIAVPFAFAAANHDDTTPVAQTRDATATGSPSARTNVVGQLPSAVPTSPSASPSASKAASSAPAAGDGQQETATASPSASPVRTTAAALSDRARANNASSASNVLIKNAGTGLCADLPNFDKGKSDGPVNQYTCDGTGGDNQLWDLQVASGVNGPDSARLFVIRNVKDGLCMDLPNYGADSSGTAVEEYACDNTVADNQLWWLVLRSDGTYWIRDYISGMCLDVTGGATAGHDARLVQSKCTDDVQDADHWSFA